VLFVYYISYHTNVANWKARNYNFFFFFNEMDEELTSEVDEVIERLAGPG